MAEANDLTAAREIVLAQLTRTIERRLHRGDLVDLAASPELSRAAQAAAAAVLDQAVLLPPGWSLEWLQDPQARLDEEAARIPEDTIEELAAKRCGSAWAHLEPKARRIWLGEARRDLQDVYPLVAARVRAEAGNVFTNALTLGARPSQVIIVGARMTEDVLNTVRVVEEAFATAVRAEAVADERQRIAADIRARKYDDAPFIGAAGPEACSLAGVRTFNAALEECASAVERPAAGSVPVATPPAKGAKSAAELVRQVAGSDPKAHDRAVARGYGVGPAATAEAAPTMGPCGHYWATGPHTYTNAAQWPNVVGNCPGPVATPTAPPSDELLDKWAAAVTLPGECAAQLVDEVRRLRAAVASPVPAERSGPGTLAYAQRVAEQRGDLMDAADEDGMGTAGPS